MMSHLVTFEQPLNESIRHFLKLEALFASYENTFQQATELGLKAALWQLLKIYHFIESCQSQGECLKTIERHIDILEKLYATPTVDRNALVSIMDELDNLKIQLEQLFELNNWVKQNFFLSQYHYRQDILGGDLNCDLPLLHSWLHQPVEQCQAFLKEGFENLIAFKQTTALILHLTRESTIPTLENAVKGRYEKSLTSSSLDCQLIRVVLSNEFNVYPIIQGTPHQIEIQFMNMQFEGLAPTPYRQNVPFELTCCMI